MWFRRLFGHRDTTPMPPPVGVTPPSQHGVGEWYFSHSKGMPEKAFMDATGRVWFDFKGGEPHMLLRRHLTPLGGTMAFKWKFAGGPLKATGGGVAHVSLIIVSMGNTWGGDPAQKDKRQYWWGPEIKGEGSHVITLTRDQWHNRDGKTSSEEDFVLAMSQPTSLGLAFGNPGAGATAHGVTGEGQFEFTLRMVP